MSSELKYEFWTKISDFWEGYTDIVVEFQTWSSIDVIFSRFSTEKPSSIKFSLIFTNKRTWGYISLGNENCRTAELIGLKFAPEINLNESSIW